MIVRAVAAFALLAALAVVGVVIALTAAGGDDTAAQVGCRSITTVAGQPVVTAGGVTVAVGEHATGTQTVANAAPTCSG